MIGGAITSHIISAQHSIYIYNQMVGLYLSLIWSALQHVHKFIPSTIKCLSSYLYLLDQQTRYIWKKVQIQLSMGFINQRVGNILQLTYCMMGWWFMVSC